MKTETFLSASRLAVMALACIFALSFTACGGGDDEPTVDELLSDKTTPVTFELAQGDYYVFDYTGNRYVGSDTIHMDKAGKCELDLRQGKHHLVWISLGDKKNQLYRQWTGFGTPEGDGQVFDTLKREILYADDNQNLAFGLTDIEVSPYLLPVQKVDFEQITACLKIEATDKLPYEPYCDDNFLFKGVSGNTGNGLLYTGYIFGVGVFSGVYPASSIYADNGACLMAKESKDITIGSEVVILDGRPEHVYIRDAFSPKVITLCPKEGFNDIQLEAKITEQSGRTVPTTPLPKFSLRRGCTTTLRGPLFSGSTADWTVTVEPYSE